LDAYGADLEENGSDIGVYKDKGPSELSV